MSSQYPEVARELDKVLRQLIKEYITSWYQDISTDPAFSNLLLDSLATLSSRLEDAILALVPSPFKKYLWSRIWSGY